MSTAVRGISGNSVRVRRKRVSPPKRSALPEDCVGNKGEHLYYCHRGDALSATGKSFTGGVHTAFFDRKISTEETK